jgi:predicted ATPase
MFVSITLEAFFSFGEKHTIELNPHSNILVGINASGKSNFIKAIEFLYESVAGVGFEKIVNQYWGGVATILNCSENDVDKISIEYTFDKDILKNQFSYNGFDFPDNPIYTIIISKNGLLNFGIEECIQAGKDVYLYIKNADGYFTIIKNNKIEQVKTGVTYIKGLVFSTLKIDRFNDDFLHFDTLKTAIQSIKYYNSFNTSAKSNIRQLSNYYSEDYLLPNGENLTMLLSFINANYPKSFDLIEEKLRKVNPHFKNMIFTTPLAGKSLLSLKENNLSRAITIDQLSDGTLNFLLLLAILYNPNRGKVVCLDEPEKGLHPDMINTIAEGIKYAANTGTQMIVATHSPLLLNSFDLEDILIFEKDAHNQTIVKKKNEEDFENWEGEFLAGQMWLRGQLGGVRW